MACSPDRQGTKGGKKGLKDTGWPLGPQQRVNAAVDTVGSGNGGTGVVGEQLEGHEEPQARGRDGNGGHRWRRAVPQQSMTG